MKFKEGDKVILIGGEFFHQKKYWEKGYGIINDKAYKVYKDYYIWIRSGTYSNTYPIKDLKKIDDNEAKLLDMIS